jgi:hypothetical protein
MNKVKIEQIEYMIEQDPSVWTCSIFFDGSTGIYTFIMRGECSKDVAKILLIDENDFYNKDDEAIKQIVLDRFYLENI